MVAICTNLNNFQYQDEIFSIFEGYSNDFEYTSEGVFRRAVPPLCQCGTQMDHNGYNTYTKKGLGSIKVGKYFCPSCEKLCEEDKGFWEDLNDSFFSVLGEFFQRLRALHVSFEGISWALELVFPRGKDTVHREFNRAVEEAEIPPAEDVEVVHYDEQFPKRGRSQKFRLTLLDGKGLVIAEELHNKKDPETIKEFLGRYLNPRKKTFVVTDLYSSYPEVFEEFFGELVHQLCLLHLNKRICKDFPKKPTIEQLLTMYRLLNTFYNREQELEFLKAMVEKEREVKDNGNYKDWLKKARSAFNSFVHELKLKRRREKRNLELRSYKSSLEVFNQLMNEIHSFGKKVRKRLRKIEKNWDHFTAFHFVEGAPATNNLMENYYSTSLKTHRKKQFRTEEGLENHMKLSQLKRAGKLNGKRTLLEVFSKFKLIDTG